MSRTIAYRGCRIERGPDGLYRIYDERGHSIEGNRYPLATLKAARHYLDLYLYSRRRTA